MSRLPSADDIAQRLQARRSGDGWIARCPAHDDRHPSLSIGVGADGRVLLHCHANCTFEKIAAKLSLGPAIESSLATDIARAGYLEAEYPYRDAEGRLVLTVQRWMTEDGKSFKRTPRGVRATDVPAYRLRDLIGAMRVWVVEGEKDADRLAALGLAATTSASGAGHWLAEHTAQVLSVAHADAEIVIIPDNDDPGTAHANSVAGQFRSAGRTVRLLQLPFKTTPPQGADVSDWLNQGGTLQALQALADATAPLLQSAGHDDPSASAPSITREERVQEAAERERVRRAARRLVDEEELRAQNAPTPQLVRAADLRDVDAPAHLVQGVITPDSLCFLWGPSNCGKTTIAIDLAVALATGGKWCGRQCERVPVALLTYEGQHAMRRRVLAASQARHTDVSTLDVYVVERPPILADGAGVAALSEMLRAAGVVVIIVDTLAAACGGVLDIDAGAGGDAAKTIAVLREVRPDGGSVLAIHHCGHDPSRMRGAYALRAAADTELHAANSALRTLKQRDLAKDFSATFGLEARHGSVVMTYGGDAAPPRDDLRERIAALLATAPGTSKTAIRKAVGGNRERVYALIDELRKP